MKEKWYKDKEKLYLVMVMIAYAIIGAIIVCFHEPFRDEAQAWLIARDTNIIEMFSLAKYEGSPMLWHCLVNILTTLGLPYISINIMHLLLNLITVYLLNKYAPFNKYIKLGITFSHMLAYQYLAIARSYILVPLLLCVIAIIYEKRHEKTLLYCSLLVLLQNVCLYSVPIALSLFVSYILEKIKLKKLDYKCVITFVACALIIIFSLGLLISSSHGEQLYHTEFPHTFGEVVEGAIKALQSIGFIFFPVGDFENLKAVLGLIMLCLATLSLLKDKKTLVIFLASTIVIGGIFAFLNLEILYRHAYMYLVVYLFSCWISKEHNLKEWGKNTAVLTIVMYFFGIQVVLLLTSVIYECGLEYSNSRSIYKFILENNYEDYKIIALHSPYASSVLPYFKDKTMLATEDNKEYTYVVWNKDFSHSNLTNYLEIYYSINIAIREYDGKVLFIGFDTKYESINNRLELIYPLKEEENIEETLYLYKLKNY